MSAMPLPERPVTTWDLFSEVTGMRRDVSKVLTKVEVMSAQQALFTAQMTDVEARLRVLQGAVPDQLGPRLMAVERWQWRTAGIMATVAFIAGILGGYLGLLIAHGK